MQIPDQDPALRAALQEILKDFDLVPKTKSLENSEYRYRLLMVQMLEKLLEEQRAKLRELETGIRPDRGMRSKVEKENRLEGFNPEWPWVDQCIYFIKREGRPLLLNQIVKCLGEVHDQARENPAYFGNSLSASLSNAIKRQRIRRHSLPKKRAGWYYPNSWADAKGNLKKQYLELID